MGPNLAVLRSALAPMLTCTGTLSRRTGRMVQDEDTGEENPEILPVWSGSCLVRPEAATEVTVGDITASRSRYDVTLPAGTEAIVGDVLTLTSAPGEPALVGVTIRLTDTPLDAYAVARLCKGETDV